MANQTENIFATGIVYDGIGILIRGESGAGKSLLSFDLMDRAESRGKESGLISDDRVLIEAEDGTLIASPPEQIKGQIELRGFGIVERPVVERHSIKLVVDISNEMDRMPENEEFETELLGVKLDRVPVPSRSLIDSVHQRLLVLEALRKIKSAVS
ncbi:HPr kinase/phosphorylase [Maritalea mediterranea]|uniref:HPr kinase/phosphatase C-terminal domain-containing protein n=1 Tax=Maritalea mediterranea TaxID=2909667 RepID=A0ABS9E2U0_9HYPH|nr:HPr kinase/phosphatase C-terminal domain-containing protein [Maritalea mediterranea]MCF4097193.1 HPr kinase/phosphatase C-terminal domain-containing protein [Maritalea mediterranea]